MTREVLCAAPRCRTIGQHAPDCDDDCRGCLPRQAADGLRVCLYHAKRINDDALDVIDVYDALAERMVGGTGGGEPVTGTPTSRVPDPAAMEARADIRAVLASWCLLVVDERGWAPPEDTVRSMCHWLAHQSDWLAAHPAVADACSELDELAHGQPRRVAYPSGTHRVVVGLCPLSPCDGTLRAIVHAADSLLPAEVVCDVNAEHRWSPMQWHALGRAMSERVAV